MTDVAVTTGSDRDEVEHDEDVPWAEEGVHHMDVHPWDEQTCKFCGSHLNPDLDPGNAWVEHIDERPDCREEFQIWRENQEGDWGGGV